MQNPSGLTREKADGIPLCRVHIIRYSSTTPQFARQWKECNNQCVAGPGACVVHHTQICEEQDIPDLMRVTMCGRNDGAFPAWKECD